MNTPTDADKHAKMRDMVMSWEEISEELVWEDYKQDGPEIQKISTDRMEWFCKRFPHFEERIRSFVSDWNREPMITQEMLAAIEHTEVSQEEIDKNWRSAKRILDFYRKLREVETELSEKSADLAAAQERIRAMEGDIPGGCTVADAQVLKKANHEFAEENKRLKDALRFYANGYHFTLGEPEAWDTVSGEPPNFWCDEAGTATVEDGSIAKAVLLGHIPDWKDEDGEDGTPPPVEGEAEYQAAIDASIAKEAERG